ncbi:Protein of unknown function [Pyronema omphalodes CBS 100304]|uniref:Uncharacterized protein n=1 Tax=Pyronema omphalodes (strain CBS 100304) TaxID=1076935 RepID=U4KZN4_PYROM|nr:Protein of unknown function [Pyronema omphalodes CBS 100304]
MTSYPDNRRLLRTRYAHAIE